MNGVFFYMQIFMHNAGMSAILTAHTHMHTHGRSGNVILQRSVWMFPPGNSSWKQGRTEPVGRRSSSAYIAWWISFFFSVHLS